MSHTRYRFTLYWLLLLVLLLSACSNATPPVETETPSVEVTELIPTPEQPTPTSIPAAAHINGEPIPLGWFESEVERYLFAQEAMGQPVENEKQAREFVLDEIIDQVLLAQGAREAGLTVSVVNVQARIDDLTTKVDLNAWMTTWGYTEEDLFQSLKLQMQAALQRDRIVENVPEIEEQVYLKQVLTYTEAGAREALGSLNAGTPFEEVADIYRTDRPAIGGSLGWVPRGYLLILAVEEAAFSLPVGAYSEIIESEIGYHIVLVVEREERPLTSDARLYLQHQALQAWLEEQRQISTIEVLDN